MGNKLYFGDNLEWLPKIQTGSVDLIYLDPPYNSKASYNVFYRSPVGNPSDAQIHAFNDAWKWESGADIAIERVRRENIEAFKVLQALQSFLSHSDTMAYLAMMTVRLLELRRVLKETGSIYLHCDPSASHYLKVVMDAIFGADNFRNEIIWLRSKNPKGSQHESKKFSPNTDSILFYSRTKTAKFYEDEVRVPLTEQELAIKYDRQDEYGGFLDGPILRSASMGKREKLNYEYKGYKPGPFGWRMEKEKLRALDEAGNLAWSKSGAPRRKLRPDDDKGEPIGSFWGDIAPVNSQAEDRIGYPTQKPRELLERVIRASTKPGDTVLDPFCGCGTAVHAAERLGRKWIGIDVTYLAIQVIEDRLRTWLPHARYEVAGIPVDEADARALAKRDPYAFQLWAVGRVGGQPRGKGADRGIDGEITFLTGLHTYGHAIVSVKAGLNVNPDMLRALKGVVEREGAQMGVFVCLNTPTRDMKIEAATSEFVDLPGGSRHMIQIVTVADLIAGPSLGILTNLNTIQAAAAAKMEDRKPIRKQRSPAEIRTSPSFKFPIEGGLKAAAQQPLSLNEPLLVNPQVKSRKKKSA